MMMRILIQSVAFIVIGGIVANSRGDSADLEPIFNGNDLDGWRGRDGLWRVEDGVIVGQTTRENRIEENTFLVWDGGDVGDFEFVAKVRYQGNNSGVQYRSKLVDEMSLSMMGYQMDLHPSPNFFGMLYAEKYDKRGKIATRGQRVEIDAMGKVNVIGKLDAKQELTDWQWNDIRIVAVGNRLIHQVNGQTTIDVTDHHPSALASGNLGLQLHRGAPMRVEFKDLQLRRLDVADAASVMSDLVSMRQSDQLGSDRPVNHAIKLDGLNVAKGFRVERVHSVDADTQGSWVSLTIDDRGRLIASDQGKKGLFRATITNGSASVQKLPIELSGAQGLLWKSGDLYASVTSEGMYRASDADGDGEFDTTELLSAYFGRGEHGNHALVDTEDGDEIYAVSGNQTPLPAATSIVRRRVQSWKEDLLLPRQWDPRGHARGILAPGGWITRFDPATKTHDVYCIGFRNEYDVAVNSLGDLFTYDADMEWDLGLPWYRPTRICLAVSGGDYGWRSGSGKSPTYYEDSLPPLVEIGPGSPTGVVSGRGGKFPEKYQHAIFALDWTYGRILAIHVRPEGAGYTAEVEDFVSGPALPVTDAVMGRDGALYFTTGGRGAKSELMRVVYVGGESTQPAVAPALPREATTRRELEAFHGIESPKAIEIAWPHLASNDRFLRHAARVAIESQPVADWADKVFTETNSQARITGTVALARMGTSAMQPHVVDCLTAIDAGSLPKSQLLGLLRAYALTFERLGRPSDAQRDAVISELNPMLPASDADINTELLRVLVYLRAPDVVAKGMRLINDHGRSSKITWGGVEKLNARYGATLKRLSSNPPPTEAILYAFMLRLTDHGWTPELRRQYFTFLNRAGKADGGASYPGYLANLRDEALATCTDAERVALADLTGEDFNPMPNFPIEPPSGPGHEWTLDEAMAAVDGRSRGKLSFERGRSLFHAVSCGACHRFDGLGGGVGPDLTSVPNKFDTSYLVEAIIHSSKNISDQYQSSMLLLDSGQVLTGLVVEQDPDTILVYSPDPKAEPTRVSRDDIDAIQPSPVSQMPSGLLNSLNADELRNLVAYIMSGGNPQHKTYGKAK